jgi:hypothetical protein
MMNSRERVLKTFRFESTDRVPFDLMEGCVWPELLDYFRERHNLQDVASVIDHVDPDFRWSFLEYTGPSPEAQDLR